MATLAHRLEFAGTKLGVEIAQRLPERGADRFGVFLGEVMRRAVSKRHDVAFDNLKRAFGDAYTDEEYREIVHQVFLNIGRTFVEFARFKNLGIAGVKRIVTGPGEEIFRRVYAEGKGGIMVSAHFGNWELLGAWVAAIGCPTDFLIGRQKNLLVDNLLVGFRQEMGVGIIPLATSVRSVFKSLKAGHITAIIADQHASGSDLVLDFFGRPAAAAKGPALFAIRAGCPLLPFMLRRERYDRHVVIPCEPIYPPNSGNEEEDIRTMTARVFRFQEEVIRQYPSQWMWTHRRWKLDSRATK